MATVVTIEKGENQLAIQKKLETLKKMAKSQKGFPATKFSGKIKSYGDGLDYQSKIRNEWR